MKQQIIVDNITYEVVATNHDELTNKDYVIYTKENINNQEISLYCIRYYEKDGQFIPIKLENHEEKETACELIKDIMQKIYRLKEKN